MVESRATSQLRRVLLVSLSLAVVGAVVFSIGMLTFRTRTMVAYLAAYTFIAALATGALFLLMMFYSIGAVWPVTVRRLFEILASVFPLLVVLFVPIALDLDVLYPWFAPHSLRDQHARELVRERAAYLNTGFFLVRAGGYLVLWMALAELLRGWSLRQDQDVSYPVWPRARRVAAAGIPAVGLTATFAAWDWVASTSALWSSAVFGLYFLASGAVAASAAVLLIGRALDRAGKLPLREDHYYAFGRTLFGVTAFFTYIGWFQFFLTWEANVPDEVSWFVARSQFGWSWASVIILILGNSILPLTALLPYRAKRSADWLVVVSTWLLAFQYLNFWWCVAPRAHACFFYGWVEIAILSFVGGTSVAFAAWRMRGKDVMPRMDPYFPVATEYHSS